MKFIVIVLLTIALTVGINSARAAFVKVSGYGVVYDDVYSQYWVQPGPALNGNFLNTLAFLDTINCADDLERHYGRTVLWGRWRLANEQDMRNLWTYDAEVLANTFEGNRDGEYCRFGRYGGQLSDERHFIAGVLLKDDGRYMLSSLPYDIVSDNIERKWLGAWIVADAAQVPVPSTLLLLFSGLGIMIVKRNQNLFSGK